MKNGEGQKRWRAKPENREKERLRTQRRWREDPKVKVRREVQNAKRDGVLPDKPCAVCGSKNVEHHHPDYSKPLDVVFICAACHRQLHKKLRAKHELDQRRN
jgi:hypothetical protein